MRFESKKSRSVRNYSSRREQLRLLLLFVPLALVIILIARLRDPKTADTVNKLFTPTEQQAPIKTRPLVAGTAPATEPAPSLVPAAIPEIRPELLKTIEDNTYFRTAEKDAWFHFFELLQKGNVDPAQAVDVEYVQLVDQPSVYRGKLVTVRGTARQITKEKPAANDLGLTSYYRVVIQPADGANWPIIVYCLELPKGVSPSDDLSLGVKVSGLFFKKLSYKWQDGLGIAPVIVARSIDSTPVASAITAAEAQPRATENVAPVESVEPPTATTDSAVEMSEVERKEIEDQQQANEEALNKILTLSGWNAERLAKLDDGQPLSEAQRLEVLELLRRLRSIDTATLEDWRQILPAGYVLKNPDEIRGKLRCLTGRVTKVVTHKLDPAVAERLEMPEYFECDLEFSNLAGPVTVLTTRVPNDWLHGNTQGAVLTDALYLKQLANETPPRSLWLAKEIAWFPGAPQKEIAIEDLFRDSRDPLLGKSLLGAGSMDVGLLDQVESRGRIRPQERDVFYNMLYAVGHMPPATLVRIAKDNLTIVKEFWEKQSQEQGPARRRLLASEVVRSADEGRYSVAMLFNDPEPQIGRLFVFDGVARRAVRVEVGGATESGMSNGVVDRFGFDHYYELEVFTNDSQNYPLIFCVRELPEGFPVGADIHVPVRAAGFFFKNWLYSTRGSRPQDGTNGGKTSGSRAQFAPLLIGPSPIMLPAVQPAGHTGRYVLGGLFVLGLIGIGIAAVQFARGDRHFRVKTPAASFSLPPGQSLNDLNLPTAEVPMMIEADSTPPSNESPK